MDINDIIGGLGGQGEEFNPMDLIGKMLGSIMQQAQAEVEDNRIKLHLEQKLGITILRDSPHCEEWRRTHANCMGCESCLGCCKLALISQRLESDSKNDALVAEASAKAGKRFDLVKAGNRCAKICLHIEESKSIIEAKYWFGIMPRWKVWKERILNRFGKSMEKSIALTTAHLPDNVTLTDLLK